jgi:hypothetical protein
MLPPHTIENPEAVRYPSVGMKYSQSMSRLPAAGVPDASSAQTPVTVGSSTAA